MNVSDIPAGDAPQALEFPHFPTRFQAVIWRNWNLVHPAQVAAVLHTTEAEIVQAAADMGLTRDDRSLKLWRERGFQTVIRRNWELLDYPQLLELLQWTPEELAFTLKEDDFFFYKLGLHKPVCGEVRFRELTAGEKLRTAEIKQLVQQTLGALPEQTALPFDFLQKHGQEKHLTVTANAPQFDLKFIYPYAALYGDPLLEKDCVSYPEGMFADYHANGVNGIWLQGTLYTLVPYLGENEPYSAHWQERLENLRTLVARAGKYGVKIFLYFNEPRSMPAEFFSRHPEWRGVAGDQGDFALCTSAPGVLEALSSGVERLFREVPALGGVFTATMSENLTHCRSRGGCCPRCEPHSAAALIAQVNNAICAGIKRSGSPARVIAYDWAWDPAWSSEVVAALDPDIAVMTVSESGLETDCFGYPGKVNDYAMSKVGPGKKAQQLWRHALDNGGRAVAKIQVNSSWELCAVPYIPVADLVEEHFDRLRKSGVTDLMLSWTLGGFAGGNLGLLCCNKAELAQQRYGAAQQAVLQAWTKFSEAFRYFPFNDVPTLYFAPQNFGPVTLLSLTPVGRDATMVGFPYDDIDTWRGAKNNPAAPALPEPIPVEIMRRSFAELSTRWAEGLAILDRFTGDLSACEAANLAELRQVAEACYCHFRSAGCQIEWALGRQEKTVAVSLLKTEHTLALRLLAVMQQDSRIGFEASNHYLYTANDLLEKILNCAYLLSQLQD